MTGLDPKQVDYRCDKWLAKQPKSVAVTYGCGGSWWHAETSEMSDVEREVADALRDVEYKLATLSMRAQKDGLPLFFRVQCNIVWPPGVL